MILVQLVTIITIPMIRMILRQIQIPILVQQRQRKAKTVDASAASTPRS